MNDYRDDNRKWCYFHPREMVVGVCALCLNERLLVLASKQSKKSYNNHSSTVPPKKKIFALPNLLIKQHKPGDYCNYSSSTSPEDSFISIKFEHNGVASWEKDKISKIPLDQKGKKMPMDGSLEKAQSMKSVVEHTKPRGGTLRWRKRIGHIFQVIKLKRSTSKGNMSTKIEGGKVKYGWIRTLTKRRTKE